MRFYRSPLCEGDWWFISKIQSKQQFATLRSNLFCQLKSTLWWPLFISHYILFAVFLSFQKIQIIRSYVTHIHSYAFFGLKHVHELIIECQQLRTAPSLQLINNSLEYMSLRYGPIPQGNNYLTFCGRLRLLRISRSNLHSLSIGFHGITTAIETLHLSRNILFLILNTSGFTHYIV